MKTRRLLLAFLAACMLIIGIPAMAMAYTEVELDLDGAWVAGEISQAKEADFYHFVVPSDGKVTVTYQGQSVEDSYYEIINEDMDHQYHHANVYYTSDINPKSSSKTISLSPGGYYVKVYAAGDRTGGYRVKASFAAFKNNETESNNSFDSAMPLAFSKTVTGALTENDEVDFYRFELTSTQTIIITYTSYMNDSRIQLWDKDYISQDNNDVYYASDDNPKTFSREYKLAAGVYYIKIFPDYTGNSENFGKYTLKIKKKIMVKSITISNNVCTIPGKTFTLKASISPSSATDKTIKWTTADSYIASVDQTTGKVTTNRVGKTKITASATDGSNVSKTVTVIVKPKKETINSIYAYTDHRVYLSYSYQSGATGYQIYKSTSKNFTSGTTSSYKTTSTYKYLTKLKKGKRYYFKVRAYYKVSSSSTKYGSWSSYKSIVAK